MIVDNITIVICAVLIVLAVLSSLLDLFFKKIPTSGDEDGQGSDACQPVSVIIICDNNAEELRTNLPVFLEQDYPAGYELIVVIDKDEDGSGDVLKTFSSYPNLYTTFVPETSRYMSRRKLAITLGVKAAKNEWVLLTDATCRPASDKWISRMASGCSENVDIVLGYSNYSCDDANFKVFYRFHREYALLREALGGTAYGMAGNNLMFRKSMFMKGNGFQGNLKYLRGEYEFIANKYSREDNVAIEIHPESHLSDAPSSTKAWRNMNVFYVETRRRLDRGFKHKFMFDVDMISMHLCLLCSLGAAAWSAVYSQWLILSFACLSLLILIVARILNAKRSMRAFGLNVSWWKIFPFELRIVWHNLRFAIVYVFADKYDFISHKS